VLAAIGIAMLVNRNHFPAMIDKMVQDQGLIFLSGILVLLGGLVIVRVHNLWTGGWPVIVTVFGWLGIVGGLARMWFPYMAAPIAETFATPTGLLGGGLLVLALGSFLTYKALGPDT
jgi:hypothetical protein